MYNNSPEASLENVDNGSIAEESLPITPVTDQAPKLPNNELPPSEQESVPDTHESGDAVFPLPSPVKKLSNGQSQLLRRISPKGVAGSSIKVDQIRRTTTTNGNDWALSPQGEEIPSRIQSRPNIQSSIETSRASTTSTQGRSSIFSVLPFLGSPTVVAKEEDPESAFVLSRLENNPLDGSESTPARWLTGQLKSAFRSLHDTVVGDISPGDVDWGI